MTCTVKAKKILINTSLHFITLSHYAMKNTHHSAFTSGVSPLRWVMMAGTDMMWMRNDLSRFSEK